MGYSDQNLLMTDEQTKAMKNFQSVFYQMNSKPENMTKIFTQNVKIRIEDIKKLNRNIADKFSHYSNAGFRIDIQLQYYNHKRLYFDSWQKFEQYQWYDDEPLLNMAIKWEMMVVLPNFEIPQKHTLTVKMSDQVTPEEIVKMVFSGEMEDIADFDKNFFPVYASVDYVDFMICEEIISIVEKWVRGLPKYSQNTSKFIRKIKEKPRLFADIIRYISDIVLMCCTIYIVNSYFSMETVKTLGQLEIIQLKKIMIYAMIYLMVISIIRKIIVFLKNSITEAFRTYGKEHVFCITEGDKKAIEHYENKNAKKKLAIVGNLILTIVINIACGIFVNIIS